MHVQGVNEGTASTFDHPIGHGIERRLGVHVQAECLRTGCLCCTSLCKDMAQQSPSPCGCQTDSSAAKSWGGSNAPFPPALRETNLHNPATMPSRCDIFYKGLRSSFEQWKHILIYLLQASSGKAARLRWREGIIRISPT
jgi:hypothetical protein